MMAQSAQVRSPLDVLVMRDRCAKWAEEHRACKTPNPWLAGPPPFDSHLPGFAQSISLDPLPHWPIAHRNVRALHGALTAILGVPHRARFPNFSLFPTANGWGVHWYRTEARSIPLVADGILFDVPTRFRFGPRVRLFAPKVGKRGHMNVTLEAITPVATVSAGRATAHTRPTRDAIVSALANEFPNRITEDTDWTQELRSRWADWVRDRVRLDIVSCITEPAHVEMGGKLGTTHGWIGAVTLNVNATARWLLGAAERMGLGSRVGYGFGCIRLRDA